VNDVTAQEYAFLVVAVIGSIAAVAVVTARNVVHAALYLVVTLSAVGMTFLLLGAEFVGWVQILIYVGAIVILFLFGLMLTKAPIGRDTLDNQQKWLGALVGLAIFAGLVFLIQDAFPVQDAVATQTFQGTTGIIGDALFRNYVLPFEAISFLLLAALIGAIVLARKDEGAR
jgi:NADH-quinone oxidoreductase subunit J